MSGGMETIRCMWSPSVSAHISAHLDLPLGNAFEVNVVYTRKTEGIEPFRDKKENDAYLGMLSKTEDMSSLRVVSIDPGTNNFCAMVNNFGDRPLIISGRYLKSVNQFYNKELARLKSAAEICNGLKTTRRIARLHRKRNNLIKDAMHKISRCVVEYCKKHNVGLVFLGHNIYQKRGICIGHVNNQNFVQIPFKEFADMLSYKLSRAGIRFVQTEESYTSRADFLAMDDMPVYGQEQESPVFSGVRIKRGLYRHFDRSISNADINGATNIMRKVFPKVRQWDRGVVDTPYVVKVV